MRSAWMAVALVLAAAGCSSGASGDDAGPTTPEGPFYAPALSDLRAAGLTVGPFAAAPEVGPDCATGEIEGFAALLCRAPLDAQVEPATARKFVDGAVSGAVRTRGGVVLAVADRQKRDPNGRALNRVLKAFDPSPTQAPARRP